MAVATISMQSLRTYAPAPTTRSHAPNRQQFHLLRHSHADPTASTHPHPPTPRHDTHFSRPPTYTTVRTRTRYIPMGSPLLLRLNTNNNQLPSALLPEYLEVTSDGTVSGMEINITCHPKESTARPVP